MLLGYAEISRNFSFLPKWYKVITVCRCKQLISNSFWACLYCMYLFLLYDLSIIILLTNNFIILLTNCWQILLTNICSEISKIRLILWMVYTCNVKGVEQIKKCLVEMNVLCSTDQDHQWWVIAVYCSSKFKAIDRKATTYGLKHRK